MIRITSNFPDFLGLVISDASIPRFKDLLNRALNCYPDAHPELKSLADELIHGKSLQDYYSQRTDKESKRDPDESTGKDTSATVDLSKWNSEFGAIIRRKEE